mmetsp:Transcript_203/g.441  ORF Transcript_203/g.441 Transcript_203/m.441 type:complete len:105 (-) Transcript_203:225-539(-)
MVDSKTQQFGNFVGTMGFIVCLCLCVQNMLASCGRRPTAKSSPTMATRIEKEGNYHRHAIRTTTPGSESGHFVRGHSRRIRRMIVSSTMWHCLGINTIPTTQKE